MRYSIAVIDDATFYSDLRVPNPTVLNQVLLEPNLSIRYRDRWTFSSSLIGIAATYDDTSTQLNVKETYAGLSAGDFDFMAGRKIVRWGVATPSLPRVCSIRCATQPIHPIASM